MFFFFFAEFSSSQYIVGRLVAWWWMIPFAYTELLTQTPSRIIQQQQASHPTDPKSVPEILRSEAQLSPEKLLAKQDQQPVLPQMPKGERALVICNHRTSLDWWWLWSWFWRQGRMQDERIVLKAPLRGAPGLGWGLQAVGPFFLSRRWAQDESYLKRALEYVGLVKTSPQILLFPEGTDFTENTKARSHAFAEKNGLPKYEYVLHPRVTGFSYFLKQMRANQSIDAVYDIT